MRQFQESIKLLEGIPAGFESNWELRRQVWERRGEAWDHVRVLATNLGAKAGSLGALTASLGAPESAGYTPERAGDMSGSTANHSRAVWKKQHLLSECSWCAWN
jgi:hypothetical protein